MAFHPLTLLGVERGRGKWYSFWKNCKRMCWRQFQVTSCKCSCIISQLQSMFSALAIQTCWNMGNKKSGSMTQMIYLLPLSGNVTYHVGAVNVGTFSINHCPALRDKREIKFPLCFRLGAAPLVLYKNICVSMVVSVPQPSPNSQIRMW